MGTEYWRNRLANDTTLYSPQDLEPDNDGGRFGHISGTKVGQIWTSRAALSDAGVHVQRTAGISGGASFGASSVVLSGGYVDDVDNGETVLYTGTGGRNDDGDFGGSAAQTKDQEFSHRHNAALLVSCQRGRPVRLIRGIADHYGRKVYRYDGLYEVKSAKKVTGSSGFQICQFELVRQQGQDPLPT